MKRVAVLGSTGSVGRNTLEVIAAHPECLQLVGIAARSRVDLVAEQMEQYGPSLVCVWEEQAAKRLELIVDGAQIMSGMAGLTELATHPDVDVVVVATSGHEALIPLVRAIQAGKRIALASKELLVMAGELIMRLVREHGTSLVPIDSEHAALFQCLQRVAKEEVARLIVTGSGGPLWKLSPAQRKLVTHTDVLAHPKWLMGPKITVDSATLMNKGLEIIEARWLFDRPLAQLQVVIHPEAVVHAIVELRDGTWLAQMSPCDMRLPIQYALSYPDRWENALPRLAITQLGSLTFAEPDLEQFPCFALALDAATAGGTACAALNAANDVAVRAYLKERLPFHEIPRVIEETMRCHTAMAHPTLDDILRVDAWARATAQELIGQHTEHCATS
ncbi:MAG: 1-deoxy-D-xylulose-5-phosphate reductoisomerase [Candidatus Omnitrophica bacterium]|nr:1-deoxy-D-xylulose-5-phosphate reductoisomerase [Candidatus Omnitrophota bacterium]